jgi:hypothetical protein
MRCLDCGRRCITVHDDRIDDHTPHVASKFTVERVATAWRGRAAFMAMLEGTQETPESVAAWIVAAVEDLPVAPVQPWLGFVVGDALQREAEASVALDHDPRMSTHYEGDGCPGGHR